MNKDWFINIWEEGKYADLWSVNHFLGGIVLAQMTIYLNLSFLSGLLLAVFLMVGWELYELAMGIEESAYNKSTDIGFGVLGFLFYVFYILKLKYYKYVFIVAFSLFVLLEFLGYLAYRLRIKRDGS